IYNRLFSMIEAGEFSLVGKLPTEPKLAKQMGVSRTTLRQALYLLQEDGIIKNIQGKGNFIIGTVQKWEKGLESLENPVYSVLNMPVEEMEIEFRLETGAEYSNKVLERKSSVVLYADIWYKSQGKGVAYTLSILPIETILEEKIDLSDEKKLLKYLT
ncbi:GntR family transcriptional regulator, partial [Fusobacterium necrophorum]|nr:GntR family transcriptional regulator [Fusobacterium necrophorum]